MNKITTGESQPITTNGLQRRTLDGREYAVAPVVALVAGVVNGELAPGEEIGRFVEAWNGRPVPVGHPKRNGVFVSANSPQGIEEALGWFFGAQMDGEKLKGELWLDVAKAQALGGEALDVFTRLEAGDHVEVSTAYFNELEVTDGMFNGKSYKGVQRNLRPDHVALLPNEVGACSWTDGCGAPRVNVQLGGVEPMEEKTGMLATAAVTAVTTNEGESATPEVIISVTTPTTPAKEATPIVSPLLDELNELAQIVREFGGVAALRDALASLRTSVDQEREALIRDLTTNRQCAFGRDELAGLSTVQLNKLQRSLRPADYSARVGVAPATVNGEWRPYEPVKAA